MPTPGNIQLTVSVNGGPPQTGAVEVDYGDEITIGLADPAGVKRVTYRIWEYPEGFECPAGWTEESGGAYAYTVNNGASAPSVTMPNVSTLLWGKYFLSAEVNERRRNGRRVADLFDQSTAVYITSQTGVEDIGFRESNQFDSRRQWAGGLKRAMRHLDNAIAVGLPSPLDVSNPAAVENLPYFDVRHFGVTGDGTTDDTAALIAAFLGVCAAGGGKLVVPNGDYLIARPAAAPDGADAGGVSVELTRSVYVLCEPGARFFTDDLDNNLFSFTVPSDGAGLPATRITLEWVGGTLDMRNQRNSTSVPFAVEYPPANLGTSGTTDGISVRGQWSDGVDSFNAFERVSVRGATFIAGDHWESAGGDSGAFVGAGAERVEITHNTFLGCRDLGVYASGGSGVTTGSLEIAHNVFKNCFFGSSAKRGFSRFSVHDNTYENCVAGIQTNIVTTVCEFGAIFSNTFVGCSYFVRLDSSRGVQIFGNIPVSLGAYREDGTTPIAPYEGGTSLGFYFRGARYCSVKDERCLTLNTGHSGVLVYLADDDDEVLLSEYNTIANCISYDFGRVVEEKSAGANNNRFETCYNYGTLGLRDPLRAGAATSVIRWVPGSAGGRWSFEQGLLAGDGTEAAPAVARRSAPDTGIYFETGAVVIGTGGSERGRLTSNGFSCQSAIRSSNGSASTPTHSFNSDPDTGIYRAGTDRLAGAAGGVRCFEFGASGLELPLKTTASPTNIGDVVIERTSNTVITIKLMGSDGVVRPFVLNAS